MDLWKFISDSCINTTRKVFILAKKTIFLRIDYNLIKSSPLSHRRDIFKNVVNRDAVDVHRKFIPGLMANDLQRCGHEGFGHYLEFRSDSLEEFAIRLRRRGHIVCMHRCDPCDIEKSFLETAWLRVEVTMHNLWRRYVVANICESRSRHWQPKSPRKIDVPITSTGSLKVSVLSNPSGNVSSGAVQSPAALGTTGSARAQSTPTQGVPSANPQGQLRPGVQAPVAPAGVGNTSNINFPPSNDFILLCFRVRRHLKRRWDLELNGVTRDRELFEDFRKAYAANFRWAHRTFSLQSVQKIKFVKVCRCASYTLLLLTRVVVQAAAAQRSRQSRLRQTTRDRSPLLS
jgi:hypothetical protein